jgi:hypothetical protein
LPFPHQCFLGRDFVDRRHVAKLAENGCIGKPLVMRALGGPANFKVQAPPAAAGSIDTLAFC